MPESEKCAVDTTACRVWQLPDRRVCEQPIKTCAVDTKACRVWQLPDRRRVANSTGNSQKRNVAKLTYVMQAKTNRGSKILICQQQSYSRCEKKTQRRAGVLLRCCRRWAIIIITVTDTIIVTDVVVIVIDTIIVTAIEADLPLADCRKVTSVSSQKRSWMSLSGCCCCCCGRPRSNCRSHTFHPPWVQRTRRSRSSRLVYRTWSNRRWST